MDVILADVLDSARSVHAPVAADRRSAPPRARHRWWSTRATRGPASRAATGSHGTQAQRAAVLAAQTAVLLSTYLRMLGHEARAHTATCSDVDLNQLRGRGLRPGRWRRGANPYVGPPLRPGGSDHDASQLARRPAAGAARPTRRWRSHGPAWWLGSGRARARARPRSTASPTRGASSASAPCRSRRCSAATRPRPSSTTPRVPRFPKRADFFARAVFGDMGKDDAEQRQGRHLRA